MDEAKLQEEFDALTDHISEEDKNELVRRTSVDAFFTAEKRINDVCKYIVNHFREYIEPSGMKAQVVVYNRECCVKYKKALDALLGTDDQTTMSVPARMLKSRTSAITAPFFRVRTASVSMRKLSWVSVVPITVRVDPFRVILIVA